MVQKERQTPREAKSQPDTAEVPTAEEHVRRVCREFATFASSRPKIAPKVWAETPNTGFSVPENAPRRVLTYGRSKSGKSFWLNFVCGCLFDRDIQFAMLDLDQDNASLSRRFPGATIRSDHNGDFEFRTTYKKTLDFQHKSGVDIFIDIGFGRSKAFRDFARQSDLQAVEEQYGIRSVLVLPVTTDVEDLMPIDLLEGIYLPRDVLLVLNEFSVPQGQDVREAYQPVLDDPRIRGLIQRKARVLHFPRLPDGHKIVACNAPLAHAELSDWPNPFDLMERVGASRFLDTAWRRMQAVADIVPFPAGDR